MVPFERALGTGKATNFKFGQTITGSIRRKAHENFWRKGSVGVSRDCLNFLGTYYYLMNGKRYGFQIWSVYIQSIRGSIRTKAH